MLAPFVLTMKIKLEVMTEDSDPCIHHRIVHSVHTCTVSSTETILVRVLNAKSDTSANLRQMPQLIVIS